MLEIGTVLQDRYKIEKQIGAGGMGAVYLAVDRRFDNYVAIKETFYRDDELGGAFEREARLLNALQHPVLPHVSDYFTEAGGHFLVMQYIEGEDLSEVLRRGGAFPFADVLRWAENLLDALDYLHSQDPPIIHRDLKPQNLKLTARGDVILLDFGLAKLSQEDTSGVKSVFGYSRKYSPLEQIQGTGTDERSDLFALGATLYHLATGKTPADALTRASAIIAGKHDPLQPAGELNPEIPAGAAHVLTTAMALNPDRRFVSAKAMRQALGQAVSEPDGEVAREEASDETAAPVAVAALTPKSEDAVPVEGEKFPALEAFVAEAVESKPPQGSAAQEVFGAPLPDEERAAPPPAADTNSRAAETGVPSRGAYTDAGARTKTSVAAARARDGKRLRTWVAAAAILSLLCGSLAAFYFRSGADSPPGQSENGAAPQSAQQSAAPDAETQSPAETASAPENFPASYRPPQEVASESKNKADVAEREVEAVGGGREEEESPSAETEARQNPAASSPAGTQRRTPPPATRATRNENAPAGDGETRSRVVGRDRPPAPPLPDIESVFTGESVDRREAREERQRRRAERRREMERMSDSEREEFLRERRRQRRQRQNDRRPLPF